MSKSIKIGNKTFNGVEYISCDCAVEAGAKRLFIDADDQNGVTDVATAAAMDALLVAANVGKIYRFTGATDSNYTNGDIYIVEEVQ